MTNWRQQNTTTFSSSNSARTRGPFDLHTSGSEGTIEQSSTKDTAEESIIGMMAALTIHSDDNPSLSST